MTPNELRRGYVKGVLWCRFGHCVSSRSLLWLHMGRLSLCTRQADGVRSKMGRARGIVVWWWWGWDGGGVLGVVAKAMSLQAHGCRRVGLRSQGEHAPQRNFMHLFSLYKRQWAGRCAACGATEVQLAAPRDLHSQTSSQTKSQGQGQGTGVRLGPGGASVPCCCFIFDGGWLARPCTPLLEAARSPAQLGRQRRQRAGGHCRDDL